MHTPHHIKWRGGALHLGDRLIERAVSHELPPQRLGFDARALAARAPLTAPHGSPQGARDAWGDRQRDAWGGRQLAHSSRHARDAAALQSSVVELQQ